MKRNMKVISNEAVMAELKLLALCRHKNVLYLVEAFQDESWM